jgi:hypothetical protein
MKLEGVFNPIYRFGCTTFVLAICTLVTWSVWHNRALVHGASLDLKLCSISLVAGLTLGLFVGRRRLRGLRAVVPLASAKPVFTQLSMIYRTPDDQKARRIERAGYLALIFLWILLFPFESHIMILPFAVSSTYVLGMYITGSYLPFVQLWLELRNTSHSPTSESDLWAGSDSGQVKLRADDEIHLLGAFNPYTQMIWGLIVTVAIGGVAVIGTRIDRSGIDPYLAPVALASGLWFGYSLGVKRLHVLHEVLPKLNGRFVVAQWDVMMSTPDGAMISKTQGWAFGIAVLGALGVPAFTNGKVSLVGSFALFGLGVFLTGKILPFVRLWLELKGRNGAIKRRA